MKFHPIAIKFTAFLFVVAFIISAFIVFNKQNKQGFLVAKDNSSSSIQNLLVKADHLPVLGTAPELVGIADWLDAKPLSLKNLKGKVVLIDFWTYSCINCIRTLPHIETWYEKYKINGFVVLDIHSPEFNFEKKIENVDSAEKASTGGNDSVGSIVLSNQGGNMEGHTPRGFKGMGTGLFAGDNLNTNFPNNDGVQIFLTFDLSNVSGSVISATLRSENVHIQGSPFQNLGVLKVETVRYDEFSSALWNVKPNSFICAVADLPDGKFECDATSAIRQALENGSIYTQFRIRFDKASNNDSQPDLVMFYKTNSNTNEPGTFRLEIKVEKNEASLSEIIHVPVALHLVKNSGAVNTGRSKNAVLDLFQKSQAIWNQADIVFDASIEETVLDEDVQKVVLQGNFGEMYKNLPADSKKLHVFFVNTLAGPNGIAIAPSLALIADQTTVNDFRATAHEIGHLLGLNHTDTSEKRLLFRGANGTQLTPEEIRVARLRAAEFML